MLILRFNLHMISNLPSILQQKAFELQFFANENVTKCKGLRVYCNTVFINIFAVKRINIFPVKRKNEIRG